MFFALLTFTLTLTLTLGGYFAFVVRPEAQVAGRLRDRLRVKSGRAADSPSVVKAAAARMRPAGLVGTIREWNRRYAVAAAARLIDSAGVRTDPHWLIVGTGTTLLFVVILLRATAAPWPVALVAGACTPFVPYFYIKYLASRRLRLFEEQFPDAISLMARALRAGHALTSTLAVVAEEMPEPIKSEFRRLYEQHNFGLPLPQVMRTFAKRIAIVDVRFFATAVLMQRETGGNLAEVLDNLGTVMRDRFRVRRQLAVLTAQGRMTGWILSVLPLVVGVGIYLVNPEQMQSFVTDPMGLRLFELAIVLEIVGVAAISRIIKVDY
jgi:tight adherence protein B